MLEKLDHIAVAVRSLAEGEALLNALGLTCEHSELVEAQRVRVAFYAVGGVHVELVEPLDPEGPISRFLGERRAAVHHLAFATDDLAGEMAALQAKGLRFVDSKPVTGSRGKQIAFLHPKTAANLLIELCQNALIKEQTDFRASAGLAE